MKTIAIAIATVSMLIGGSVVLPPTAQTTNDIITLPEPESPFIAFNIWVKVGSQNDPVGKEGLAALTASLLSDGSTSEDSYEQILEKLYPMAAGYGYGVDKEMTVLTGRIHRDNLEEYYTLFKNSLLSPAFSEEDFQRVKSRTMNYLERGRRFGRDEELTRELLSREAYKNTPYEHPEEGYVTTVRSLTLDDVRDFYRRIYVRNNIVVGVGGGYPAGFPERVRNDFNTLPDGEVAPVEKPEPRRPNGIKILIVEKETDATPVSMGFPISLLRGDDDFWAMMAVNSWMGEHRNSFSNLYQVIRETRGMNYGDYSYIEAFPRSYTTTQPPVNAARRSHLFEIWIRPISNTEPGNLHTRVLFATRAALRELQALARDGISQGEMERTQRFLHNYTVNWGNTISRRLAYAMDDAFYGMGGEGYLAGIRPGLAAVTLDAANEAIRTHLQSENMYLVFITNNAQAMKQTILSGVPTNLTYGGPQPRSVITEDRRIAGFPIRVRADDIQIIHISEVFER